MQTITHFFFKRLDVTGSLYRRQRDLVVFQLLEELITGPAVIQAHVQHSTHMHTSLYKHKCHEHCMVLFHCQNNYTAD